MTETIQIPKILIYEEFDGHPIYRKGYRDFMLGLKTIGEINMGTSTLQWFITSSLNKFLIKYLPDNYLCGSGELGLHISNKTNFVADIAIYREGQLKVGFHSIKYEKIHQMSLLKLILKLTNQNISKTRKNIFIERLKNYYNGALKKLFGFFLHLVEF